MEQIGTLGVAKSTIELRLATKVAWMYYEEGKKQHEIAAELHVSQSRVSRLLKAATAEGIVRTVVAPPAGVFTELEAAVERSFGIEECLVVETRGSEEAILNDLGLAAANYLLNTVMSHEIIGISSWSASWLAAARHLSGSRPNAADKVVQLVGGVGVPEVQTQATLLLNRFARATGAEPVYLQVPGILADAEAKQTLMKDPSLATVERLWGQLTIALIGIGSVEPSPLLRESGTILDGVVDEVQALGGVGDICFRYFDDAGQPLAGGVDSRIAGISAAQLRRVPRRVAAAGGERKTAAIRAALRGGWVTTLITDTDSATALL